jgi:hypothetical protein
MIRICARPPGMPANERALAAVAANQDSGNVRLLDLDTLTDASQMDRPRLSTSPCA